MGNERKRERIERETMERKVGWRKDSQGSEVGGEGRMDGERRKHGEKEGWRENREGERWRGR